MKKILTSNSPSLLYFSQNSFLHFSISSICFLFFLCIFDIFFSILPVHSCFIVWIKDFIKRILQKYGFFFQKIWHVWNPKFHQNFIVLQFLSYFFSIFDIYFFYFTCPKLSKNYGISCNVLLERLEILSSNYQNF